MEKCFMNPTDFFIFYYYYIHDFDFDYFIVSDFVHKKFNNNNIVFIKRMIHLLTSLRAEGKLKKKK